MQPSSSSDGIRPPDLSSPTTANTIPTHTCRSTDPRPILSRALDLLKQQQHHTTCHNTSSSTPPTPLTTTTATTNSSSPAVRALSLLESAISAGCIDASYHLATLLHAGAPGVERDLPRAVALHERLAREHDHAAAMNHLGLILRGSGRYSGDVDAAIVKRDVKRARDLFERAVEKGYVDAMNNLGLLLQEEEDDDDDDNGSENSDSDSDSDSDSESECESECEGESGGCDEDDDRASRRIAAAKALFERAAEHGNVNAMCNLAKLLVLSSDADNHTNGNTTIDNLDANENNRNNNDCHRAVVLYERAISLGDIHALTELAILLRDGAPGVNRDIVRAAALFESACLHDCPDALYNLGKLLTDGGSGVPSDAARAKLLFERAVELGDQEALNNLGLLYKNGGEGVERDAVRAKALFERAVDGHGSVFAMTNLGVLLKEGATGVERDVERARDLLTIAAERGNVDAMFTLGVLLVSGDRDCNGDATSDGEDEEQAEGEERVETEAQKGERETTKVTKKGAKFQKDCVAAKNLFEQAIAHGDVMAMNELAVLLEDGGDGVEQDIDAAMTLFQRAADRGNVDAMCNLAGLLLDGHVGESSNAHGYWRGMTKRQGNARRARLLYEEAAERGDAMAMNELGLLLKSGSRGDDEYDEEDEEDGNGVVGVKKDIVGAQYMFELAIEHGSIDALLNLAKLHLDNIGILESSTIYTTLPIHYLDFDHYHRVIQTRHSSSPSSSPPGDTSPNYETARMLYEMAAVQGDAEAMRTLGTLYQIGLGTIVQDGKRARLMFEKAVEAEDKTAVFALAMLLERGAAGVEVDHERAEELYLDGVEKCGSEIVCGVARYLEEGVNGGDGGSGGTGGGGGSGSGGEDGKGGAAGGGRMMERRRERRRDLKRAEMLYQKAADKGNAEAMCRLANILLRRAQRRSTVAARRRERRAKQQDEEQQQEQDDEDDDNGGKVEKEQQDRTYQARARSLLERAVEQGHVNALSMLASLLLQQGQEQQEHDDDCDNDGEYYSNDRTNNVNVKVRCTYTSKRDAGRAKELYECAAFEHGVVAAMNCLAQLYQDGDVGVDRNAKRARKLYAGAAKREDVAAMVGLAGMVRESDGAKAGKLYRRALELVNEDEGKAIGERAVRELAGVLIEEKGKEKGREELRRIGLNLMYGLGERGVRNGVGATAVLTYCAATDTDTECDLTAMVHLGVLLGCGGCGVYRDIRQARRLLMGVMWAGERETEVRVEVNLGLVLTYVFDRADELEVEVGDELFKTRGRRAGVCARLILGMVLVYGEGGEEGEYEEDEMVWDEEEDDDDGEEDSQKRREREREEGRQVLRELVDDKTHTDNDDVRTLLRHQALRLDSVDGCNSSSGTMKDEEREQQETSAMERKQQAAMAAA